MRNHSSLERPRALNLFWDVFCGRENRGWAVAFPRLQRVWFGDGQLDALDFILVSASPRP